MTRVGSSSREPSISTCSSLVNLFLSKFIFRNSYPGPRGFSWAAREPRRGEVETRSGEKKKTSGYFGLESHFHADSRVKIWPSGLGLVGIFTNTKINDWFVWLVKPKLANLSLHTSHACSKVDGKRKKVNSSYSSELGHRKWNWQWTSDEVIWSCSGPLFINWACVSQL